MRVINVRTLVVYSIECETCGNEYIGKTERILIHRMKEHGNAKKNSAIQTHLKENPGHKIDVSNIRIIDKADTNYKLMIKEMLHINNQKPVLNTQHAAFYKNNNKELFNAQLNTIIIAKRV